MRRGWRVTLAVAVVPVAGLAVGIYEAERPAPYQPAHLAPAHGECAPGPCPWATTSQP